MVGRGKAELDGYLEAQKDTWFSAKQQLAFTSIFYALRGHDYQLQSIPALQPVLNVRLRFEDWNFNTLSPSTAEAHTCGGSDALHSQCSRVRMQPGCQMCGF